jgi:ubiquinone/menaquinone biosynthesis C-methylase UbiE
VRHSDHVSLIRKGVPSYGGIWADLGSGEGAFTLALAELLGPGGVIYSVDKNGRALEQQRAAFARRFPAAEVHYHKADFRQHLSFLPRLDGLLMANSLHFIERKEHLLKQLMGYLGENGRFLLVEYSSDHGNRWVPYPLAYSSWQSLARRVGFSRTELLDTYPGRFLGGFYAALSS